VTIHGGVYSAEHYLRWLKSEVEFLPQVFADVNENFMFVAVAGVLQMLKGEISPPPCDVKKVSRMVAKEWWHITFCY
jgi:hypothetical protein